MVQGLGPELLPNVEKIRNRININESPVEFLLLLTLGDSTPNQKSALITVMHPQHRCYPCLGVDGYDPNS